MTMRRHDLLKLAVLALRQRPQRTLLMTLGVVIGTVCIVLMLSTGYSGYQRFAAMLADSSALTRIEVSGYHIDAAERSQLTDNAIEAISTLPHVTAASPVLDVPALLRAGRYEAAATVTGIEPAVLRCAFSQGGLFASNEAMPSLVIGAEAAKFFVDPEDPPDYTDWETYRGYSPEVDWMTAVVEMKVGYADMDEGIPPSLGCRARVAGIISADQSGESGRIYMDLAALKNMLQNNREAAAYLGIPLGSYQQAVIRVDDMENVALVTEAVRQLGFEAFSETEYILEMQAERARQQMQLLIFGLISLCVAAVGIANTMYASVLEARSEIGIMKVVGMKLRHIRWLYVLQAGIIGLAGGIAGLLVSGIIVLVINTGTGSIEMPGTDLAGGAGISVPFWVAVGAVGIAVGVGTLSGLYPAWKATKMRPLEAMRDG